MFLFKKYFYRLLRVVAFETEGKINKNNYFGEEKIFIFKVTLVAFYQTHFPEDAFEPEELPFFALIG